MTHGTKKAPALLADLVAFQMWAEHAPKGSWALYYTGSLTNDRMNSGGQSAACVMGAEAWALHMTGRFLLVQRRPVGAAPNVFDYLIIKRRTKPNEKPA